MNLPERIVAVTTSLDRAHVPHAFGGAIALAYCVPEPRATIDLDINVFVDPERAPGVLEALPGGVEHDAGSVASIAADGQVRLWWDQTPVDLFFNTTDFHRAAAGRARREPFAGIDLPVLACRDLAVFKAFFDRNKDWVDLEAMAEGGVLDAASVAGVLAQYLGPDDHRIVRILDLAG